MVNEGQLANALPNAPADGKYTSEQMMILAPKYAADMEGAIEHAQDVRIVAYRSHDIIRMTCIDDKIAQMKTLENLASPRMLMMRTFKAEPIVMRVEFDVISQVHDRVTALGAEVDACMGDNLDAVSAGRIHEESQPDHRHQRPDPSADADSGHRPPPRGEPLQLSRPGGLISPPCTHRCRGSCSGRRCSPRRRWRAPRGR